MYTLGPNIDLHIDLPMSKSLRWRNHPRTQKENLSSNSLTRKIPSQDKTLTSVASHFLRYHDGKTEGIKVVGLDLIKTNIGGDSVPALLRKESQWIYELNAFTPGGLNRELLFIKSFIY